ncbi:hypothetical protein AMATHDRAFT_61538 [Amanita thiersii Skay4041]|uniref:Alpha/beta hydrolase fold-3 domain-containing protein n=1 Tax=Amanita thiersii Skay4041 TaxID=703135 RepID=A0A2A9NPE8_9AGAR|nr:hypothetical protein AMATHDRAFT_61538 [Amanita thiersii Skay4041]
MNATSSNRRIYGQTTSLEKVAIFGHVLLLPFVVFWNTLTWPIYPESKEKPFNRHVHDVTLRHLLNLGIAQVQYLSGPTSQVYRAWAKKQNVPVVVEELGLNARLYWIGSKKSDRVIFYLHGGAYLLPMGEPALSFWKFIQQELAKQGINVGIAVLEYTLYPDAQFPVPLSQAVSGLKHLLEDLGVSPQHIQLAGDSAGGNLVLQVISHILHPVDNVPRISLSTPLRGAYLVSPWVLLSDTQKYASYACTHDLWSYSTATKWGRAIVKDIPDVYTPYIQALKAPHTWFRGVDQVVDRVLMTTGDLDLLKDTITEFEPLFRTHHPHVELTIQRNGIHDGPFFDSQSSEIALSSLRWFANGFKRN